MLVFVYGSLRRGEEYHGFLATATPLGPHITPPIYDMWDLDGYPAVTPGGSTAIHGELYAVDDPTLAALDELEEVPTLYQRGHTPTPHGAAAIYLVNVRPTGASALPSGRWTAR